MQSTGTLRIAPDADAAIGEQEMAVVSTALRQINSFRRLNRAALAIPRRVIWGVLDQSVISVANFVTFLLLARELSVANFGLFNLVYAGLLFSYSMQSSLITQPHNVIGVAHQDDEYITYTTTCAFGQVFLSAGAASLVFVGALIAQAVEWDGNSLLWALGPAIFAWQLQEFGRRVLYTEGRLGAALANDIISYCGQTVVVLLLWRLDRLTGPWALYVLALTSAMAVVVGGWQIRRSLGWHVNITLLRKNWSFGKWLAGGEIGRWFSDQVYIYVAAVLLSPASAGVLLAVHLFFGPLRVISYFLNTVLPTWFTQSLTTQGKSALHEQLKSTYRFVTPILATYCLFIAIFAPPLLHLAYGSKYEDYALVLVLYALLSFINHLLAILTAALYAQRMTRPVFVGYLCASGVAVTTGWLLIGVLGTEGAVVGMMATALISAIIYWRAYNRGDPVDRTAVGSTLTGTTG
ncbi:MAG: hypothetical protein QOF33_895 [Thermomicrobiales bacterium]|nr:hypothetical protein [Thermomicrobiales bacterium]